MCERSLKSTQNGPSMPLVQHFVRAEMLPSGYLIRPCDGGGSIIHIVDHMDLEVTSLTFKNFYASNQCLGNFNQTVWIFVLLIQACSVPEVLRPLYESPKVLAQKTTMAVSELKLIILLLLRSDLWNYCSSIMYIQFVSRRCASSNK